MDGMSYTDEELDLLVARGALGSIVWRNRLLRTTEAIRQLRQQRDDLEARLEGAEAARDMYFEETMELQEKLEEATDAS